MCNNNRVLLGESDLQLLDTLTHTVEYAHEIEQRELGQLPGTNSEDDKRWYDIAYRPLRESQFLKIVRVARKLAIQNRQLRATLQQITKLVNDPAVSHPSLLAAQEMAVMTLNLTELITLPERKVGRNEQK